MAQQAAFKPSGPSWRQISSTHGLIHRPAPAAKYMPALQSRKHTQSHNSPSRVSKRRHFMPRKLGSRTRAKNSARSIGQVIIKGFKASVEQTYHQAVEDVIKALADAEQHSTIRLQNTSLTYRKELGRFQAKRGSLLELFQPNVSQGASPTTMEVREHNSSAFVNCQDAFRDTLNRKQDLLDVHWKEWVNLQQRICCLGMEILGIEDIPASWCHGISKKFHDEACAFDEHPSMEGEIAGKRKKQSIDVGILTQETQKRLAAQEKAWADDKKNHREQMFQLAKQMVACL